MAGAWLEICRLQGQEISVASFLTKLANGALLNVSSAELAGIIRASYLFAESCL